MEICESSIFHSILWLPHAALLPFCSSSIFCPKLCYSCQLKGRRPREGSWNRNKVRHWQGVGEVGPLWQNYITYVIYIGWHSAKFYAGKTYRNEWAWLMKEWTWMCGHRQFSLPVSFSCEFSDIPTGQQKLDLNSLFFLFGQYFCLWWGCLYSLRYSHRKWIITHLDQQECHLHMQTMAWSCIRNTESKQHGMLGVLLSFHKQC